MPAIGLVTWRETRVERLRGSIRRRGNSYLVEVYAGIDPLTGKRIYLDGVDDAHDPRHPVASP